MVHDSFRGSALEERAWMGRVAPILLPEGGGEEEREGEKRERDGKRKGEGEGRERSCAIGRLLPTPFSPSRPFSVGWAPHTQGSAPHF